MKERYVPMTYTNQKSITVRVTTRQTQPDDTSTDRSLPHHE